MISSYCDGEIDIIRNSYDEWGNITSTTTISTIICHIEDFNEVVKDESGKEVFGNVTVCIPIDNVDEVMYTDRVKMKKKNNVATQNPNKEYDILKLAKWNNFSEQFWEVLI